MYHIKIQDLLTHLKLNLLLIFLGFISILFGNKNKQFFFLLIISRN